jgi:hypothetical protein
MRAPVLRSAIVRTRKHLCVVLSLCTLAVSLTACGGGKETSEDGQSSLPLSAAGPDGAAVRMRALGAGSSEATLRVARDSSGAPALDPRLLPLGAVYQYTPFGWLGEEIEIRVPFSTANGATQPRLMVAQPGGRWSEVVDARQEGSLMVGKVLQLGYAVVVSSSEGARFGDRISALATRARSLSGAETSPALAVSIGAATAPAMPPAQPGAWPRVTTQTLLALELAYDLPSCSVAPVVEVVGMTWQGELQNIRYVNLGLRNLPARSGTQIYQMPLTQAENGNWVFMAEAYCLEPERSEVSYSKTAHSSKFTVAIGNPTSVPAPTLTSHPGDQSAVSGSVVTFTVSAQGDSLAYEWQRSNDGGASYSTIVGATNSTFAISVALTDNGALFRVRITNAGGTIVSTPGLLTVTAITTAPVVTNDPSNQSVLEGESATFAVTGVGQPAPSIQWQQRAPGIAAPEDGWSDVVGATTNSYTVLSTTSAQTGTQFRAVLRNTAGTSASNPATLTVTARQFAPSITTSPAAADVVAGQLGLFSVVASGTTPLSYQWYRNGEPILGANGSEVLVPTTAADAGTSFQIHVRVSNAVGVATSTPVALRVTMSGTQVSAEQGGTIGGPSGSSLVIPPGALGSDATVSVTPLAVGSSDIPQEMAVVGDAVRIQPATLSLQQPALLQLPAPSDLPVGMTFAVLRLESLEDDGTGTSVRLSENVNLRRSASQGATSMPRRVGALRFRMPGSLTCENPLNIDANGMFGKFVSQPGSYLTVMTPISSCTTVQPTASTPDVPSTSEQKCVNNADFWPMNGGSDDELHSLVSRHVDCRLGTTYTENLYTELVQSNGSYRFPTQSDPPSSIGGYTFGSAQFRVKMATFGPYNQLSKRISVTIEALGFTLDPTYRGPSATTIMVRPQFVCGSSYEDNSVTPSCVVSGQPIAVRLSGGASTGEFTVNFSWPARPAPEKDVLTFGLHSGRFEYAIQGAPFVQVRGEASYVSPNMGGGLYVRCDNRVAQSTSRGCVFPQAAAVLVQRRSGAGIDENSAHIAEAQARGAPGAFRMKPGFRAIAADEVRGSSALHRTQVDVVSRANNAAACTRQYSIINALLRTSSSCPNGAADSQCQCDEYPFASTYEGAFSVMPNLPSVDVPNTASAKYILGTHNGAAGSALGEFYLKQRVIDLSTLTGEAGTPSNPDPAYSRNTGDSFWVKIVP